MVFVYNFEREHLFEYMRNFNGYDLHRRTNCGVDEYNTYVDMNCINFLREVNDAICKNDADSYVILQIVST